jgi:hypothetical protein
MKSDDVMPMSWSCRKRILFKRLSSQAGSIRRTCVWVAVSVH